MEVTTGKRGFTLTREFLTAKMQPTGVRELLSGVGKAHTHQNWVQNRLT